MSGDNLTPVEETELERREAVESKRLARRRWITRPVAVPMWALILAAVVLVGLAAAAGNSETPTETAASTTSTDVATTFPPLRATALPTTTTTTAPTTTTTAPPPTEAEKKAAWAAAFEQIRTATADTLQSKASLQSVDRIEFDQGSGTVVIAVTTGYRTDEIIRDKAWEITGGMLAFWQDPSDRLPDYSPAFRLVADQLTYSCSGDFMRQLADRRAGRNEWQSACGR